MPLTLSPALRSARIAYDYPSTASVTGDATEQTLYSMTVNAADVQALDTLVLRFAFDFIQNSGGTVSETIRVKLGATTLFTWATSITTSANRAKVAAEVSIDLAALNDQRNDFRCFVSAIGNADINALQAGSSAVGANATAEDLSTSKTLLVTLQHGSATSTSHKRYKASLVRMR